MLYTMILETTVLVYRILCMFLALLYLIWTKTGLKSVTFRLAAQTRSNRKPQRIPNHLSLVFFEETLSVPDVANLIHWSFEFGVSVLSVCDVQGQIIQKSDLVHRILEKRGLIEHWTQDSKRRYFYRFTVENDRHSQNFVVNYHLTNYGLENLCDLARVVCQSPKSLSDAELADAVYDTSSLPDVELTIQFGTFTSLLGTFPWHSGWSEFLNMTTHWHVQREDFRHTISRLDNIKQRWGR
ncbi:hypothetical protein FGIG_10113 [Fasciola gigantica]|uniref:ditrans,polycis-polyprenyl diphosphate synthase [(2E,6E)-farnesyldiphosphate specific] n=1 Tax=Fasciola gigantica TaxID=46835 RepID=A0A504YP83_FASGI|nr:hypothetical protein FGIG_10113 [Fasciola gigantica]